MPSCLIIDVGARRAEVREFPAEWAERFIGGTGLATRLLWELTPAAADPLGPQNAAVFATGPLVATALTTTSKFAIAAKSPLTGLLGESLCSSQFAIDLRRTGVDAVALVGASEEWLAVVVEDGEVRFTSARPWVGRPAAEVGIGGYSVCAIGSAGERFVLYATLSHEGRHAGRSGLGAVLGSKRVKALAVRGTRPVRVAQPERLEAIAAEFRRRSLGPATAKYRHLGTIANLAALSRLGALPGPNFQESAPRAGGPLEGLASAGREFCAHCTIGCTHMFGSGSGRVRLEYETAYALGPLVGIEAPEVLLSAARLCDELGIDTISTGGTIAWAMECTQRGLLDGPRFGDAEGLLATIRAIGGREGIGDLLAVGSRRAAQRLGGGSEQWALHVKGMELPGYDPRRLPAMALGLAVGPRGACHNRSGAYEVDFDPAAPDPVEGAIATENRMAVLDSMIVCKFLRGCFMEFQREAGEMLQAATGQQVDVRSAGPRIVDLKKAYNQREGWTVADDALPARVKPPGHEERVRAYYRARGWNANGTLRTSRLQALGLEAVGALADCAQAR